MAKDSDDCEFWLPPQFLTDDDELFAEFKAPKNDGRNGLGFGADYQRGFSCGFFGFGPNSDLSSPVDGSTETESDEEDYITELTRQISRSTLHDSGLAYENRKGWSLAGSPQSTLCSALGGCDCNQGSSRGSPNGPSRVSSPPEASRTDGAWDLLYAAAGEVARIRMAESGTGFRSKNNGLFVPRKPGPISVPHKTPTPNLGFQPSQPHPPYQHLKALQFEQLKQQQLMKQHGAHVWGQPKHQLCNNQQLPQNRERMSKPALAMAAWPTLEQSHRQQLQPQPGSGMRAVFLGNPVSKRECAGTGVFLPRRFGTPAETRKKSGCSTVLLPDRVVQALNLNLGVADTQVHNNRYNGSLGSDHDFSTGKQRNVMVLPQAQQRRSMLRPQTVVSTEVRLPQEWTY